MHAFTHIFKIEIDKKRIFGLDVMRCLAILFVVFTHSLDLLPKSINKNYFSFLPFPDGVAVFFVLSGFLIGGILIKILEKDKASFKTLLSFWKRRWIRTLPAYFLVLIIILVLSFLVIDNFNEKEIFSYFIFSQNIFTPHPAFFVEAWSLSIEEWFYLLTPVLIFFCMGILKLAPKKSVLIVIIAVIIFSISVRYYRYLTIEVSSVEIFGKIFRGQVVTRLDNLMFGVLCAYIAFYHTTTWIRYKNQTFVLGLLLILLNIYIPKFYFPASVFYWCNLSFIFTATAIGLTLPWLSQLKKGKGMLYKFVTYTSLISYSMYLIHGALILHLILARIRFLQSPIITVAVLRYIFYWIIIYAFSILLYKYFEKPIMLMRSKS